MAYFKQQRPEKVTVPSLRASKERGEKLVCLTAYDYPTARIIDESGVEIILVGDSLGNVVLGYENTIPVTLDEMVSATRAVRRGVTRALRSHADLLGALLFLLHLESRLLRLLFSDQFILDGLGELL